MSDVKPQASGLKETVRARLEAGEAVSEKDFPGFSENYIRGIFSGLQNAKYAGPKGPIALTRNKANKTWRKAAA